MSDSGQLLDGYWGLILVNVAFQTGYCTFVLSNYMKALPHEMYEAARGRRGGRPHPVLPASPCPVPAGAGAGHPPGDLDLQRVLLATVLMQSSDEFPITSSLNNLRGQFFTDYNLLSAGSILVAIRPDRVLPYCSRKQFVADLTLGATKG